MRLQSKVNGGNRADEPAPSSAPEYDARSGYSEHKAVVVATVAPVVDCRLDRRHCRLLLNYHYICSSLSSSNRLGLVDGCWLRLVVRWRSCTLRRLDVRVSRLRRRVCGGRLLGRVSRLLRRRGVVARLLLGLRGIRWLLRVTLLLRRWVGPSVGIGLRSCCRVRHHRKNGVCARPRRLWRVLFLPRPNKRCLASPVGTHTHSFYSSSSDDYCQGLLHRSRRCFLWLATCLLFVKAA